MLKLCVYIPESHVESVKKALFAAGAGAIGNYAQCCWQVLGTGQFCPNNQANPVLGISGQLEEVAEFRVEMLVSEEHYAVVKKALERAHPYETPAFDWVKLWQPAIV